MQMLLMTVLSHLFSNLHWTYILCPWKLCKVVFLTNFCLHFSMSKHYFFVVFLGKYLHVFLSKCLLPGDGKWRADYTRGMCWNDLFLIQHWRKGWEKELGSAWDSTVQSWLVHWCLTCRVHWPYINRHFRNRLLDHGDCQDLGTRSHLVGGDRICRGKKGYCPCQ